MQQEQRLDIPVALHQSGPMVVLRSLVLLLFLALSLAPARAQTADSPWLYQGSDISPDASWRFGTLSTGLRYAVRRSALPAGQVAVRIRIDAGALHEEEAERGWAHFVEHMLFRGTERFPDRRARQVWQELGASFGSDSNARTTPTETVYVLNLPRAERAALDTSLQVLADMMAAARFEPAAVEAERPVVLAEMGRRPELSQRMIEASRPLFYRGLRFAERDTIGTRETLTAATAEGLKAFYRRWYRPERATIVMVGDADEAMMEELIRARFGGWQAQGPRPQDPDFGAVVEATSPVATVAYPGTPTSATVMWLRPYQPLPHTRALERSFLEEALAERILNRRLEAHARGRSAFLSASVDASRSRHIVEATQLGVVARNAEWEPALQESFAIIADALRAPPSAAEIEREIRNLRTGAQAALHAEATIPSQIRAEQLIGAVSSGTVVASAQTVLENFEANVPLMTPDRIGAAMQRLFSGSGPRMLLVSPAAIPGGEAALAGALAEARVAAPALRQPERTVSFENLPPLGPPGREVSRERIEDMDVTIVRFANGSTLSFKKTPFDNGSAIVRLRWGDGLIGLGPDRPSLAWLAGLVGPSGIADLDLDALERLLTGRRIGLSFRVEEDALVMGGQTSPADLHDQLRLLTAKLTHPRWDPELFARFRTAAVESFDLHFVSAAARAGREYGGVIRPNDERWRPVERQQMASATVEQFRDYFAPLLAQGPVQVTIVGDVELEAAVEAVRRTVAALPSRPEPAAAANGATLRPPAANPQPRRFTHEGDPAQAYALIGWSTVGGRDRIKERRALTLAASIFQERLFDRLREQEGASYSPSASHLSSDAFRDWGILQAAAEIRPESADTFFRIAREIAADLAARPVPTEEFARAQNPILTNVERRIATNGYWADTIEDWIDHPEEIASARSYLSDYRSLTPEDIRRAFAAFVADEGDWSMLVLPARGTAAREGSSGR